MERSDTIAELTKALAKAQQAFLPIKRTERVGYDTTKGRKQYNYAPLNEVIDSTRKGLSENGLAIMQPTKVIEDRLFVETWLCHSSGEYVQCEMFVGDIKELPQAEGSSLTYKRRYSLSSLLGIASEEDDDAEAATGRDKKPTEKATTATPASEHWCPVHKVNFFMRGKMRAFAHPIEGNPGEWCNEHKPEPGQLKVEDMQATKDEPPPEEETGKTEQFSFEAEYTQANIDKYKAAREELDLTGEQVKNILGVATLKLWVQAGHTVDEAILALKKGKA